MTRKFTKVEKDLAEVSDEFSQELQDRVNKHKENSAWSISSRSLEIVIKDRTVRSYKNFDEAFRDRYLLDKRLTGFRIALISGNIEFYIGVDSSKMNFRIEPPRDVSEVQEIYTTVYEWAMEIRRHARIQGIWGKAAKQRWKLLIAGLGLPIFLAFANRISASGSIKQELLSMSEITNKNVVDAVSLLVQLQKAQEFAPFSISQKPWLIPYLGVLIYLAILLFIRPKVELDIGKGRDAIHRWQLWQWIVLLPVVFLVGDVLRPYIAELVRNFLFLIR